MEQQDIKQFASTLAEVITNIQNNINSLHEQSKTMLSQLEDQNRQLDRSSTVNDDIKSSFSAYKESVANNLQKLDEQYMALKERYEELTDKMKDDMESIQNTIPEIQASLKLFQDEFETMTKSSSDYVQELASQLNENFVEWDDKSKTLIKDLDKRLEELDAEINIHLKSAAKAISEKLEPSLKELIASLVVATGNIKTLFYVNFVMIILSLIAIVATFVVLIVK